MPNRSELGAAIRSAYDLSETQVTTPDQVVALFWKLVRKHRRGLDCVLDVGAGDCRFAKGGLFQNYVGVEIDARRLNRTTDFPKNSRVIRGCAFSHRARNYDAFIGNPPYVRHHEIESPWKEQTVEKLERELQVRLDRHCNLYLYFLCLGLLKTHESGLIALIIPYEWVSRPSAEAIRRYIIRNQWNVQVYRFQTAIFKGVMTTASVSIIDKKKRDGRWSFFDLKEDYEIEARTGMVDSGRGILRHDDKKNIWAMRGLSPGTQKIFTLTETERVKHKLTKRDVVPCVTSLRSLPRHITTLSKRTFSKYFVRAGKRCWLIKSSSPVLSRSLRNYLSGIPMKRRSTYTCRNQTPWYNYLPHPVPKLLIGSAFTTFGPKIVMNSVRAGAVGSVFGIHSEQRLPLRSLRTYIFSINFEKRVVPHAKTLKKIEVKQFNSVLNRFAIRNGLNGTTTRQR